MTERIRKILVLLRQFDKENILMASKHMKLHNIIVIETTDNLYNNIISLLKCKCFKNCNIQAGVLCLRLLTIYS